MLVQCCLSSFEIDHFSDKIILRAEDIRSVLYTPTLIYLTLRQSRLQYITLLLLLLLANDPPGLEVAPDYVIWLGGGLQTTVPFQFE